MKPGHPLRVLIVDDSEIVRDRLTASLAGLETIQIAGYAEGVADACRLLREEPPEAVILDHRLSDGTGFEVLREVKMRAPHACVIILTNHADEQYRRMYLHAGADHYLDKSNEFQNITGLLLQLRGRGTEGPYEEQV